jgi:hypothetical protein
MKFLFLSSVAVKITAFWDATQCTLVDSYRRFGLK